MLHQDFQVIRNWMTQPRQHGHVFFKVYGDEMLFHKLNEAMHLDLVENIMFATKNMKIF